MTALHDPQADYAAAWKALPRRDRTELMRAAMAGRRAINRWDAAITLWWAQRELRTGLRNSLLVAAGVALGLVLFAWAQTGDLPRTLKEGFAANPVLPVFFLIPIASNSLRRPKLRLSSQLNAAVLAGKTFNSPPGPEEAERLLNRARKEGWFRGTRPQS